MHHGKPQLVEGTMRQLVLLVFGLSVLLLAAPVMAQEYYTEGSISRVILLKIKPGRFNAFMEDLRDNVRPVWEEEKNQGLIMDYKVYLNSTTDTPGDWDVALALQYKNYAALDGLTAKVQDLTLKHYGSKGARQEVLNKRVENAEVVASRLMREITLK
jgi:hypothetical protein